MAVSKTHPAAAIVEAISAGQSLFGENRVQEFAGKRDEVLAAAGAKFHLIGHLQSNKAARAVELFDGIDSVDSLKLAERLNEAAARLNRRLGVLIEINISGEEAKSGLTPLRGVVCLARRAGEAYESGNSRMHDRAAVYPRSGGP